MREQIENLFSLCACVFVGEGHTWTDSRWPFAVAALRRQCEPECRPRNAERSSGIQLERHPGIA